MTAKPFKRNSQAYQKARARFLATCKARRAPCWICGGEIDYSAPPNTSQAFEVDHIVPVSTPQGQRTAYDVTGWRPSHCSCNRSRQAKQHTPPPEPTGRWVAPSW
jgi:HNH endonuclease